DLPFARGEHQEPGTPCEDADRRASHHHPRAQARDPVLRALLSRSSAPAGPPGRRGLRAATRSDKPVLEMAVRLQMMPSAHFGCIRGRDPTKEEHAGCRSVHMYWEWSWPEARANDSGR